MQFPTATGVSRDTGRKTGSEDPFGADNKTDEELMEVLVTGGFLSAAVKPQSKDATFTWLIDAGKWYLLFEESFYIVGSSIDGLVMQAERDGWLTGSYTGSAKDIVIPFSLNGETIKAIGNRSFHSVGLVAVSFHNNSKLEAIQRQAFRNNQLTEVKLPDSLTTIGEHAFRENPNLKKITIGANVNIEHAAFGFNRDDNTFRDVYESNNKAAGTYVFVDGNWVKQ